MFEGNISRRSFLRVGAIGLLSVAGCSGDKSMENPSRIGVESPPKSSTVLEGEDFEIRRMGKNVFWIKGSLRWNAVNYISERCDVISVGAWELNGDHVNRVGQNTVVVRDGDCIPELR